MSKSSIVAASVLVLSFSVVFAQERASKQKPKEFGSVVEEVGHEEFGGLRFAVKLELVPEVRRAGQIQFGHQRIGAGEELDLAEADEGVVDEGETAVNVELDVASDHAAQIDRLREIGIRSRSLIE